MSNQEDKSLKITYFKKKADICPLCNEEFYGEDLLSGGGRLIAGGITDELRRNYDENKKYGIIYPMIYSIMVCPNCYYSAFPDDFAKINVRIKERLTEHEEVRYNIVNTLFPGIDFKEERNIEHGLCSYLLATSCYSYFERKYCPTLRRAQSSLRTAWIAQDMANHYKNQLFQQMYKIFYRKAAKYFGQALDLSQNGKEPIDGNKYIGPDTDNNYGYDGLLYITGVLNYKVAKSEKDIEKKGKQLVKIRRIMAKLYGGGKASKDKPAIILNNSKDMYDEIGKEVKKIETELGFIIS